jgi:hypothetical protein
MQKTKQKHKTGNIGYTRRRKTKQKHNTICVGHHNTQTKTNYVNKTCVLQTTGGKDEPNIVFFAEIVTDIPTLNSQEHILCCVFVLFFFFLCTLCCQFCVFVLFFFFLCTLCCQFCEEKQNKNTKLAT